MAVKLTEAELSQWDKKTITIGGRNIDLYISETDDGNGGIVTTVHAVDEYKFLMEFGDSADKQSVAETILMFLEQAEEADVV